MPTLYMLIGVPASGKSTWIATQPFDWNKTVIASTDGYIDRIAKQNASTYNAMFKSHFDDATKEMGATVRHAIANGLDIVWDQTNTSVKGRASKLAMFPKDYKKVAVVFPTPNKEELARRLASREGKNIPDHVMRSMIDSLATPSSAEGFDEIKVL